MLTTADKRAAFRKLHESGCFIIPNPFDVGSAKALQHLGFKALASTSAGFAWTIGKADNRVTVDDVCNHLTAICAAVDIPVNADFEDGFAHEPDKVGVNVARAVKTGVAGLSIEDFTGDNANRCSIERSRSIASSRAQGDRCGQEWRPAHRPPARRSARGEGYEPRDRPPHRLCRGRRRLPLRAGHLHQGRNLNRGEAVHPKPVNLLVGAAGRRLQTPAPSACAASASAARSRVWPGPAS